MQLPKRKKMRLSNFNYSSYGAYFVTICTRNRECLLGEFVGYDAHIVPQMQLSQYGNVIEKYLNGIIGVDKYVIMPNHIHMIIKIISSENGMMKASSPTNQSIPQLIKSFKILITKEIGFSLFQRSYYDHIISNKQEDQKIWTYIDANLMTWEQDCFHETNHH